MPGGEKPGGSAALGGGEPRGEAAMRTRCGGGDPGGRSGRPGGRKEGGRWRGVTRIRPWVGLGDLNITILGGGLILRASAAPAPGLMGGLALRWCGGGNRILGERARSRAWGGAMYPPPPTMYIGRSGGRARGPARNGGGEGAGAWPGVEELGTSSHFDAGSKLDF